MVNLVFYPCYVTIPFFHPVCPTCSAYVHVHVHMCHSSLPLLSLSSFHSACNLINPLFGSLFFSLHIFVQSKATRTPTLYILHKTSYDKYVFSSHFFWLVCLLRFWLHVENLHFMKNLNGLFKRFIFWVLQFAMALNFIALAANKNQDYELEWSVNVRRA